MFKIIIIFLVVFYTAICANACNLNFSRHCNNISPQLIVDYFKRNNLCIQINNKSLSEEYTKKLYKSLRLYINQIFWENIPSFNKILKIIVTFNENTQEFDFESYFTEKETCPDILYV
jgi:hypothetical protein